MIGEGDDWPSSLYGSWWGTPMTDQFRKLRTGERLAMLMGWCKLNELLHKAAEDPYVMASDAASDFTALAIELTGPGVLRKTSVADALEPLRREFARHEAELRGVVKNAGFRAAEGWVAGEWDARRPKAYASKQKFADAYVERVAEKFGIAVSARTIRDRWLKGR